MIFCFDIDGTLLQTRLDNGKGYVVQWAKIEIIALLNKLYNEGHTIIIQTGRHWKWLQQTKQQLEDHGIQYHTLIMGNVVADVYINDRAVKPDEFITIMEVNNGE